MKRRISPYLVAIPAFAVLLLFKIWPMIESFLISFRDYSFKIGIFASPYVGLSNYQEFFGSFYFWRLFRNTVVMFTLPAILTCLIALPAILCIRKLPNRALKCLALCLLAFPALIPVQTLAGAIKGLSESGALPAGILTALHLTESRTNLLAVPAVYPWIYAVMDTLKYMIFPIFIGVLVTDGRSDRLSSRILRVLLGYLIFRFVLFHPVSRILTTLLYNPMVYETADVLGSFVYRKGLLEGNYGFNTAIDTFKFITQALIGTPVFFLLRNHVVRGGPALHMESRGKFSPSSLAGLAGIVLVGAGSMLLLYHLIAGAFSEKVTPDMLFANSSLVTALGNGFLYSLGGAAIFTALAVSLAYPLTKRGKAYPLFLFLLLTANFTFAEYLQFRRFGLIDTRFGAILMSGISVLGAFVLHWITMRYADGADNFKKYLKITAPAILVVFVLGFILAWENNTTPTILQNRGNFPASILLREVFVQNDLTKAFSTALTESQATAVKHWVAILLSLPPVFAGWALLFLHRTKN